MAAKPLDTITFHVLWVCAVVCAGLMDFPSLRFNGSDNKCQGVIQQRHEKSWLPLCITSFNSNLTSMICRELKCGAPIPERPIELQPLSNSSMALNVTCPPVDSLRNCNISLVTGADCDGAAVLNCTEEPLLRLSGGGSPCAGRVEIFMDGVWGAVCDDRWDALDAQVTCQQLGCGSALAAYKGSFFGTGPPQIHLDDVDCLGSEHFLWKCPSRREHDCTEEEHAGVLCTGHREVRLSGGPNNCSGLLEVYIDGVWATVCESHWYEEDSNMLCAYLGCGSFVNHTKHKHSLSTSVTLVCSKPTSLWECQVYPKNPNTCHQAKAVGIVCLGDFHDGTPTVTPFSPTGTHPVRSDSSHPYFIIVCALLLSLLLISVLVFTTIIWRLRLKQKSSQQNLPLTRHNVYRDYRASMMRPTQSPDDSLQIPVLYTGPAPPSPHTRSKEPVPVTIPRVPPSVTAMDDEEDYDFCSTPPRPLATFHESPSVRPDPVTEFSNFEKSSVRCRGSSSTSSGEQNWYENYRYQGEGAEGLMPPPQSYDGSSEYDDINSLSSV